MRLIRISWFFVVAALFWASHESASAQAQKATPKQNTAVKKAPGTPATTKGTATKTAVTKAAATKAPVRNQYKRSTSIRRTYGTGKSAANRRVASKARSKAPAPRRVFYNPGQYTPSPDRYVEIEKALADRGYLQKEPDGKWDQRSAEALKQFQTKHNLRADGKLSSMALIALGLGPKRIPAAAVTPTNPQAPKLPAPPSAPDANPLPPTPPPTGNEPPAAADSNGSPQ